MLIICKKYPLPGLLASEGTKDVTQGLIPAVADIKKNRLAITGKRSENHNDLANYLVAEEGSSLDDIYDLAISTDGKIIYIVKAISTDGKIFFACRPDLPDDGKDVRNAIQTVVDTWLIFDKDGGA